MASLQGARAIAQYLGVSEPSIIRWRRERGLPAILIGGGPYRRLVTTTDAITAWLAAHNQAQQLQRCRKTGNENDDPNG